MTAVVDGSPVGSAPRNLRPPARRGRLHPLPRRLQAMARVARPNDDPALVPALASRAGQGTQVQMRLLQGELPRAAAITPPAELGCQRRRRSPRPSRRTTGAVTFVPPFPDGYWKESPSGTVYGDGTVLLYTTVTFGSRFTAALLRPGDAAWRASIPSTASSAPRTTAARSWYAERPRRLDARPAARRVQAQPCGREERVGRVASSRMARRHVRLARPPALHLPHPGNPREVAARSKMEEAAAAGGGGSNYSNKRHSN